MLIAAAIHVATVRFSEDEDIVRGFVHLGGGCGGRKIGAVDMRAKGSVGHAVRGRRRNCFEAGGGTC